MSSLNIFSQITLPQDRERFFRDLMNERVPVECRGSLSGTLICRPISITQTELNVHVVALDQTLSKIPDQDVIASFSVGNEMLFLKSRLRQVPDGYALDIQSQMYKLLRRDTYRVRFPEAYPATLFLERVDDHVLQTEYDLLNLNSGGFAFQIRGLASNIFKPGSEIHGDLRVGDILKTHVRGNVRHQTQMESEPGIASVGVQLAGINDREKERLVSTVLRIHRDIFAKI